MVSQGRFWVGIMCVIGWWFQGLGVEGYVHSMPLVAYWLNSTYTLVPKSNVMDHGNERNFNFEIKLCATRGGWFIGLYKIPFTSLDKIPIFTNGGLFLS